MYVLLAAVFFVSVFLGVAFVTLSAARFVARRHTRGPGRNAWWGRHRRRVLRFYAVWFGSYAVFLALGTGPENLALYPPRETSPYKLPWQGGVSRFVAQGNRSFTSHRGNHLRAWDFVMPVGTEVLAARAGRVVEVEDGFDGIGLPSNFVRVEHVDGTRAMYAHIRRGGAVVHVGDEVVQGEPIARSGMVGQTIFPHLHFVVQTQDGAAAVPISFVDVPEGVPLAGRTYTSGQ